MPWYKNLHCKDKRANNKGRFPRIKLDHEELKQLYHDNTPIKDIASYFNCSIPTIKRHLRLIILDNLRRYKFYYSGSNELNQRIIKLYTNHHYSTEKIAELVRVCAETVRKRLRRLGIELRGKNFKNLETFHPMKLNRKNDKQYPIQDIDEFNNKFIEYYCLMYSQKRIAELLHIDRGTVRRRIAYFRSQYRFKMRFCKRCDELFRFMVKGRQKNCKFCGRCIVY